MEAIIASFMLLTAVLISVSVFDASLQAEASNEKRTIAALAAESALSEIQQSANLDLTQLPALYNGRVWRLAEYPDFEITTLVQPARLAIPCTVLESQYDPAAVFPDPTGRFLERSSMVVDMTVRWQNSGSQQVRIVENVTSLAAAGPFELRILLGNGSAASGTTVVTVARNAKEPFSARALAGGRPVADIQLSWHVQSLTGTGSISAVSRDGSQCEYHNGYRNYNNTLKFAPGACRLVVTATYQGQEAVSKVRIENAP